MIKFDLLKYERALYQKGITLVAGVDEVGRGPLAGPLVVAAVILKPNAILKYTNDSKKLSPKIRERALEEIKANALAIETVFIEPDEIDQINIYNATKKAMKEAVESLKITPEFVLIDAMVLDIEIESESIIKGDSKSLSIAAASVVAKTTRDKYMEEMDKRYPNYGFQKNKGYPTKEHIEKITNYGITKIHRKSFNPIKTLLENKVIKEN